MSDSLMYSGDALLNEVVVGAAMGPGETGVEFEATTIMVRGAGHSVSQCRDKSSDDMVARIGDSEFHSAPPPLPTSPKAFKIVSSWIVRLRCKLDRSSLSQARFVAKRPFADAVQSLQKEYYALAGRRSYSAVRVLIFDCKRR
jgi:hypothetical protein